MNIPKNYRKPVLFAVLFHVLLLCALIFNFASNLFSMPPSSSPMKTIHATSVSQASVDTEIKQAEQSVRQKAVERARASELAQKRQRQLARQAEAQKLKAVAAAKHALILQENKMAQLKAQQLEKEKKHKQTLAKTAAETEMKKELAQQVETEKLQAAHASELAQKRQRQLAREAEAQKLNAEQKALQQKLMQQQISGEQKSLTQVQSLAQQGVIDKYKAEILSAIQSNWRIDQVNSKLKCIYSVSLAPDGTVLSVSLMKSSGDAALDQSAQQAITLSSPLPVPSDPSEFNHFRRLVITLSPQGILQSISSS